MKFVIVCLLFLVLVAVGYQLYGVAGNYFSLRGRFIDFQKTADELKVENKNLEKKINYFANPHNLIKEARLRLNYRLPNERMIIIVPPQNNE